MTSKASPVLFAFAGAVLWFISGFVQGGLRMSADPELVVGFSEFFRGLGWALIIAAGIGFARPA